MSHTKVFKLTGIACKSQLISCSSVEPDAWVSLADHCEEVKALKMERIHDLNQIGGLQEENARLKAEVEAHEKRWAESEDLISHYKQQRDEAINDCECSRLKAEVERLRKHGDAMAEALEAAGFNNAKDFWNAAKEGKQP